MNKQITITDSFKITGKVEAVSIANSHGSHITTEVPHISVYINNGIKGDNHSGRRLSDVREKDLNAFGIPKRTEIVNFREFSAISVEEMIDVAKAMDIESIPHGLLGENILVSGIPNFTMLPIGTKLFFKNKNVPQTAVLIVSGENTPCRVPGDAIQQAYPQQEKLATQFIKHAIGKRGVVGNVFCSGRITKGDEIIAVIPRQYIYQP